MERDEPEVGSELLASRAQRALEWLAALPAEHGSIAVVSHKHFLAALTGLHPHTVAQRAFENCERRTVLLCSAPPPSASSMEVDGERPCPSDGASRRWGSNDAPDDTIALVSKRPTKKVASYLKEQEITNTRAHISKLQGKSRKPLGS